MLGVLMLQHPSPEAWWKWVTESLLLGVVGASVLGCLVGYAAAKLLGMDALISVFRGGLVFNLSVDEREEQEEEQIQEAVAKSKRGFVPWISSTTSSASMRSRAASSISSLTLHSSSRVANGLQVPNFLRSTV